MCFNNTLFGTSCASLFEFSCDSLRLTAYCSAVLIYKISHNLFQVRVVFLVIRLICCASFAYTNRIIIREINMRYKLCKACGNECVFSTAQKSSKVGDIQQEIVAKFSLRLFPSNRLLRSPSRLSGFGKI